MQHPASRSPPPPPPPHGENPRTTAGAHPKYEIFMIPEHSAGAGFLYLPSLKPNINSFVAGFASALMCVVVIQSLRPAIQQWWNEFQGMGNMGMMMLVVAVGLGAWAFGRQQADSTKGGADSRTDHERRRGPFTSTGSGSFGGGPGAYSSPPPPPPRNGPPPHQHAPPPHSGPPPNQHAPPPQPPPNSGPPPTHHHQPPPRPPEPEPARPTPQPETSRTETPKNAWEKAREETRKREEERKAREADQKRREEAARRLRELREKEAREREQREKDRREREQRDKEAKEREAKEKERLLQETRMREQREKELRDRLERERQLREKVEREAKEAKEKLERERKDREAKEKEVENKARTGSTYAYSSVGERTSMWPNGRPPAPSSQPASPATPRAPPSATSTSASPTKKPPAPTAKSTAGTEDEYSYRPYDKPKRPAHKKSVSDFSETSWAPSQSTARTTPPPSMRSPYTTKDPDKIVIRAVYCFLNQFAKTPASQLISGLGTVTDGLILRITTEGLFIDDDVRGVPQREWDVKAWTLKLVEVWCPTHSLSSSSTSSASSGATPANHTFFKTIPTRRADKGAPKTLVGDEADAFLIEMLGACKGGCRVGESPFTNAAAAAAARSSATSSSVSGGSNSHKTGDWKAKGLHLLRATVRDQDGKRYLFVLSEEESWKVAVGLQRLRRGTQVRALGVSSMGQLEVKNMLETLGW
ncbi:hypothetical protein BR93DRAFT_947975 [Coniochaeta sp. PMI_546]|nr:hypothetical protein BR93DRAFT_947975 [Coniochaeta sp. PMI_546]